MDSGYTLNALTIDGKELDRSATYSFLIYGDRDWYMSTVMEEMVTQIQANLKSDSYYCNDSKCICRGCTGIFGCWNERAFVKAYCDG